jgi:hypothetical protein
MDLSFTIAAGPRQRSYSQVRGQVPLFISPIYREARLYPQALGSLFIASYDSQGYGGGIRPRLHTESNLSYNRSSLYRLRTDNTENTSHVIPSQRAHWRTDCCLAMSYNIRPLRHIFHCCTLECVYRAVA